ncbi:MAG: hypothetical protein QNK23_09585 [Crocinitomicaceae bacterium]|nr:hypothetical protein [Crocinitomicaceae bacterium]
MLKLSSFLCSILLVQMAVAQSDWQWTELQNMPFQTSNNAVCEAEVGGSEFVYSFGGIDPTLVYSGIHNRCFRYDVTANSWMEIDTLPDAPKIASGASYVNGRVYIIGGYHVSSGGGEVSSDKVHVFNPVTNLFEADATPIPIPIDDQVQCVYKDSLIFIVTGWSNSGNVPNVQIYNTYSDQWTAGTNTTSNAFYTAFGASGTIIGDTIYYHGGASGGSFGARKYMRRGYINPNDPADITWSLMDDAPGEAGYRSACSSMGSTIFWVGGAPTSYNYDGIAYDGSGGVNPSARVLHFNNSLQIYADETSQPYGVMDLRGIAKLANNRWIICGGMDTNQVVSNRTFLLENNSLGIFEFTPSIFAVNNFGTYVVIQSPNIGEARIVDEQGKTLKEFAPASTFEFHRMRSGMGIYYFIQNNQIIRIIL